jgi:hypothetical protein
MCITNLQPPRYLFSIALLAPTTQSGHQPQKIY